MRPHSFCTRAYEVYRDMLAHGLGLLALTALDFVPIALIWHEYRTLYRRRALIA